MATSASALCAYCTKPNPLLMPVAESLCTSMLSMGPKAAKMGRRSASVIWYCSEPTYSRSESALNTGCSLLGGYCVCCTVTG